MLSLSAKSVKATIVLDAMELAGFIVPNGSPGMAFEVLVEGRKICGKLNAKTLRRCIATIGEDPAGFAVVLQGRLGPDSVLVDAGIAAQPRAAKPAQAEAA